MSKNQATNTDQRTTVSAAEKTTMQAESISDRPHANPDTNSNDAKKKAAQAEEAECEFLIAADLTLYANPLRCLQQRSPSSKQEPATDHSNTKEMIAADLVKYGSPLDDKPK